MASRLELLVPVVNEPSFPGENDRASTFPEEDSKSNDKNRVDDDLMPEDPFLD